MLSEHNGDFEKALEWVAKQVVGLAKARGIKMDQEEAKAALRPLVTPKKLVAIEKQLSPVDKSKLSEPSKL